MLIVWTSDLMPWKRPIQSDEYSVMRPNGTLRPTPKLQVGFKLMAKKTLGMNAVEPASPPSPTLVGLLAAAGVLPLLVNLVDGMMTWPPNRRCLPLPRRAIPAGFHHTVDASSATAAAPA